MEEQIKFRMSRRFFRTSLGSSLDSILRFAEVFDGLNQNRAVSERISNFTRILKGDYNFIDGKISLNEHDEEFNFERSFNQARSFAFETIDYFRSYEGSLLIGELSREVLENQLCEVLGIAKNKRIADLEKRKARMARTVGGRLETYVSNVKSTYSLIESSSAEYKLNSTVRENLTKLARVLGGTERYDAGDKQGKLIWKWEDRLAESQKILCSLEETTRKSQADGTIGKTQAQRIYLYARKALEIGIDENSNLGRKYGESAKWSNYTGFSNLKETWAVEDQISPETRNVENRQGTNNLLNYIGAARNSVVEGIRKNAGAWKPSFLFRKIAEGATATIGSYLASSF